MSKGNISHRSNQTKNVMPNFDISSNLELKYLFYSILK